MNIYMTARFRVRPDSLELCKRAISDFITYIKETEPGTLLYISLQEEDDDTSFLHFFIFESKEAQEAHRTSEGVKRFTDILYPELVDGVEFSAYRLFSTTEKERY